MSLDNYINEADHQLSDKDNYKQLPNNPTLQYNEMLSNTLERFQTKNLLLKKMQKAWKYSIQKYQNFISNQRYIKIHKDT